MISQRLELRIFLITIKNTKVLLRSPGRLTLPRKPLPKSKEDDGVYTLVHLSLAIFVSLCPNTSESIGSVIAGWQLIYRLQKSTVNWRKVLAPKSWEGFPGKNVGGIADTIVWPLDPVDRLGSNLKGPFSAV